LEFQRAASDLRHAVGDNVVWHEFRSLTNFAFLEKGEDVMKDGRR
jgi:hypothetical protein